MNDITRLLRAMELGEKGAAEKLFAADYGELRALAGAKMARERPGHTLQPTALVHEAWLRLGGDVPAAWENRRHFFGAAAEAMRRLDADAIGRSGAGPTGTFDSCLFVCIRGYALSLFDAGLRMKHGGPALPLDETRRIHPGRRPGAAGGGSRSVS
ncbi:MAG TPA: ECF-type sigma factor [Opitutaceae bacterium]